MLGSHQRTYDAVFSHPVARNLQWHDVRAMLTALSDITEERADGLKFSRNGQALIVRPPRGKDFSDADELMRIRHFLERSTATPAKGTDDGAHLLVVLDHRQARVFRTELHGSVPQLVAPHDPHGLDRYLHRVGNDSNGQRRPEPRAFYDAIARTLEGAQSILVLGSSTGASSAMDQLMDQLKEHHPGIARNVAGTMVVNEQHMSDDQLLAAARQFYSAGGPHAS